MLSNWVKSNCIWFSSVCLSVYYYFYLYMYIYLNDNFCRWLVSCRPILKCTVRHLRWNLTSRPTYGQERGEGNRVYSQAHYLPSTGETARSRKRINWVSGGDTLRTRTINDRDSNNRVSATPAVCSPFSALHVTECSLSCAVNTAKESANNYFIGWRSEFIKTVNPQTRLTLTDQTSRQRWIIYRWSVY